MSGHISRYMKIFFPAIISSIGGILIFLSDLIGNLRIKKNPDLYLDIQFIGLIFFIVGVIIYIFIAEFKELKEEESKPLLTIKKYYTEYKHAFRTKGEDREKIGEWYFAIVSIANTPENLENGKTAEKATTELVFTSSDGKSKRIDYARWWDKDTELFSTTPLYLKSLKQIDIEPGHPEDLVLAFRKKEGKTIYSHYYTDYKNIDERYEDNKLGIPPIDVSIKLQGKFKPVEFDRILDLDDEDNFLLREKQWE